MIIKSFQNVMEGGGVGGEYDGEDTEKMWKYQWTMSPLLRLGTFSHPGFEYKFCYNIDF